MKIAYKYSTTILMSLALVNLWSCFQPSCRGAEQTPVNSAERIRGLGSEDPGLLPLDQAPRFSSSVLTEATGAELTVMSISKVTSRTNGSFTELRQNVALEATEPQLINFLRNIAATNSALRVQSLAVHPTPDRSRLRVSMTIVGDYRLPAAGQSREPAAAQLEHLVLGQRRHLREAALDCYNLTKSTLPPTWQLDSLNFHDGKRISAQGQAPANQVRLLEDVRAKLETAQARDGKDLFVPSSGEATMRMAAAPGSTNFFWSIQFDLRPPELASP